MDKTIQITLRYAHLALQHRLEAVDRLYDTGVALGSRNSQENRTSDFEQFSTVQLNRAKLELFES